MTYTEEHLQTAIAKFNAGEFESERAAARAYRITRTTFIAGLHGHTSRRDHSHEYEQRLFQVQEAFLEAWIFDEDTRGLPPSHARVREWQFEFFAMI
ncbi:hypothetical protein K432DRAFT_313615 [Lepidopterella palustris CBS 459.81]|uniref:HTH CENPB-type domain-containing protein n=1 Tax=Lepidopterella palustris CBS 459.81 TaxID=1314670 RepID=A0A8E2DX42_9PEZI|nr:hypothetical protein K432DRAFT_313615 [Lepidopterella palustris CBS 459.81]